MTAKYATTCAVCASGIRPGEEIGKAGSGWAHLACADTGGTCIHIDDETGFDCSK